jgi:hypothetical protein
MTGSLFMQHTPSRFTKVAEPQAALAQGAPCPLRHAHPGFTRFMAEHPRISRFIAEHPKMSRFVFRVAHHIPVVDKYVPIAAHIAPVFHQRAMRPRRIPSQKL